MVSWLEQKPRQNNRVWYHQSNARRGTTSTPQTFRCAESFFCPPFFVFVKCNRQLLAIKIVI
jgi:hypothetical protein